jgi:hypothetical protein
VPARSGRQFADGVKKKPGQSDRAVRKVRLQLRPGVEQPVACFGESYKRFDSLRESRLFIENALPKTGRKKG